MDDDQLIGGSVMSDSLREVLLGLCNLVQKQQTEISTLKEEIEKKADNACFKTFQKAVKQRVGEIADQIERIDKDLKDEVASNSVSLNNIRTQIEIQGTELNDRMEKAKIEVESDINISTVTVKARLTENQKEMDEIKEFNRKLSIDTRSLKELFNKSGLESFESLTQKLLEVEQKMEIVEAMTNKTKEDVQLNSIELDKKISQIKEGIGGEIYAIQSRLQNMRYETDEVKDIKSAEGGDSADMYPIIRMTSANTRRIDGIDQQNSSIRLEVENLSKAMQEVFRTVNLFGTSVNELKNALHDTTQNMVDRFCLLKQFFRNLGEYIRDNTNFNARITTSLSHIASNVERGLEDMGQIIASISSRPLPSIKSLDEVIIEVSALNDAVTDKCNAFDFERNMFTIAPVFKGAPKIELSNDESLPEEYQPTLQAKHPSIQKEQPRGKKEEQSGLISVSFNNLRDKVVELEQRMPNFMQSVNERLKEVEIQIHNKAEISEIDRLFDMHNRDIKQLNKTLKRSTQPKPPTTTQHLPETPDRPIREVRGRLLKADPLGRINSRRPSTSVRERLAFPILDHNS